MTQNKLPPKISSLRISFEMPSSFTSLQNAFCVLFGPSFLPSVYQMSQEVASSPITCYSILILWP